VGRRKKDSGHIERSYGILPFILEEVEGTPSLTPRAGLVTVAETARGMGLPAVAEDAVCIEQRQQGCSDWEFIESFLLSVLRRTALPAEFARARPKRLRFHLFCVAASLIHHARQTMARVVGTFEDLAVRLSSVRRALWQATPAWASTRPRLDSGYPCLRLRPQPSGMLSCTEGLGSVRLGKL